jgi:DnaJ-class molecular chaperone
VLGIALTATQAEAKKAWRKLAVDNHPDRFRGAEKAEREHRAKTINAAWDTYRTHRGWT